MRYTPDNITKLEPNEIFTFGSNESGVHGAGAARAAEQRFGAKRHHGEGHHGQSYAIPTRAFMGNAGLVTLSLPKIRGYVETFISYAREHPELTFLVTEIGCGYAGLKTEEIGPMFALAPDNVVLPKAFYPPTETARPPGWGKADWKPAPHGFPRA